MPDRSRTALKGLRGLKHAARSRSILRSGVSNRVRAQEFLVPACSHTCKRAGGLQVGHPTWGFKIGPKHRSYRLAQSTTTNGLEDYRNGHSTFAWKEGVKTLNIDRRFNTVSNYLMTRSGDSSQELVMGLNHFLPSLTLSRYRCANKDFPRMVHCQWP